MEQNQLLTHTKDSKADMQRRCGEQYGMFYDRKGDLFRDGVDPRNYHGQFVYRSKVRVMDWTHASDCWAAFSDRPCTCRDNLNG